MWDFWGPSLEMFVRGWGKVLGSFWEFLVGYVVKLLELFGRLLGAVLELPVAILGNNASSDVLYSLLFTYFRALLLLAPG